MMNRDEYNTEWLLWVEIIERVEYCAICGNPTDNPARYIDHQPICSDCDFRIRDYQARVNARIERFYGRAEKAEQERIAQFDAAHKMAERIPFGQPILVGHHSEARDRRYRARIEATYERSYKAMKRGQHYEARAKASEKHSQRAISSDDPLGVIKLQEKIAKAERLQEIMREANKLVRKLAKNETLTPDQRIEQLVSAFPGEISQKSAAEMFRPSYGGRLGFEAFELSNNSANIKRMKERLANLRAKEQARVIAGDNPTSVEDTTLPGVTIERNLEHNRLMLHFPAKPNEETRRILKSCGFVWSHKNQAWQRMLTSSAEYGAERAINLIQNL